MKLQLARAQALLNQTKPKPDEAMKVLQPLVKRKNAPWPVYHYSGIAFIQKKEYGTALSFLNESIKQGADAAETYHSISICYFNLGNYELAEENEQKALDRRPDFFKGWLHLGSIYRAEARLEEALKCYQKANELDPKSSGIAFRIAEIYNDQGDLKKALELYQITVKMDPEYYEAYLAMSQVLRKQHKYDEAEECIYKVLKDEPKHMAARVELAEHFKFTGNYEKAIELYEKMIREFPKVGGIRVNYALCLQELGRFDESEEHYMIAFRDQPEAFEPLTNYLMGVHYNPERTKQEIFEAHKLWEQNFAPKERPRRPVPFDASKEKKLRLGFISGGFRAHPVGWMITKALENLPSDRFEVYCYTTNNSYDRITRRIHEATDKWQSVIGYNDQVIAGMIKKDEIDILVELSGHSADTRLKTVVLEPAPVIIKWVGGLFNTTGLKSVDYLLTDHHETPKGEEKFYTEKLIRMPDDYICFLPPDYAPKVGDLPSQKNGYVTFGCFNNPTKVNDEILVKWAQIMSCVPDSRLFLKSKQYDTEALRERIINTMKENGIEEDRLRFEGLSPHDELLDKYNEVDIALDPWPYSGGLTTCEALWMGVPVVTKPGPTFAGRHSTTHLINAGLTELVVDTWDAYVDKTVELASNPEKLSELRSGLRKQVAGSPLADGPRFGAHFAKAMRGAWHQWVDGFENKVEDWQNHIDVGAMDDQQIERTSQPSKPSDDVQGMLDHIENEINGPASDDAKQLADPAPANGEVSVNGVHANGSEMTNGVKGQTEANKEIPDTYKIETTDGVTVCTPPDLKMLTPYVLLEQKQWYENELVFVRDYLQPGMTVLDVGAGFGVYSLPAAKLVGEEGKVFAFEPGTVAKHHLEMSKLENGFQNLEIIGKALSDKTGKHKWKTAETPELNKLDEAGEEDVSTVTLDAWWQFEGEPEVDFLKLDINGSEGDVIKGSKELLKQQSPIVLVSIADQNDGAMLESLIGSGYRVFEYIPGPGIFADHDIEAGSDPYMQNLIAIPENQIEEFKKEGWLHDESVKTIEIEKDLWKTELSKLSWTHELMEQWENHGDSERIMSYLQALNYLIAAGQIDAKDSEIEQPRSQKAGLLLGAAQILIQLYNQGANSTSIVFTLVRTLNDLGKRDQAVQVMQKLIETTKLGQENMNVDLPFMLPIPEQDNAPIKTDLNKWLMVRTVEAWILLKDLTTYLSGPQEQKLLDVLEGNSEVIRMAIRGCRIHQYLINDENYSKIIDLFSPDFLKEITFSPDRDDYFKSMVKMIHKHGADEFKKHDLPGELVVSLTSYPARFEHLPLTLLSLIKQSVSPDKIILWIAEGDKDKLTQEIIQFKDHGVDICFCEDLGSYKKIIPTLETHPEAFIITADDDLYYNKRWVEGLVREYESNENVIAYRVHRISFTESGSLKPYKEWGWEYRESFEPSDLNFPTSGAGTLYPPGIFHEDVNNVELFQKLSPTADDVWLYFMVKLNGGKFKVCRYGHQLMEWKQENQNTLWKENLINGKNDEQIKKVVNKFGFSSVVERSNKKFKVGKKSGKTKYKNLSKILFLAPGKVHAAHGIYNNRATYMTAEARREGIDAEILYLSDPNFIQKIVELCKNPKHAIDAASTGYPSWVTIDRGYSANLFDALNANTFALLSDHLFVDFMWHRLDRMSANTSYYTAGESLFDELECLGPGNNSSFIIDFGFPFSSVNKKVKRHELREIDLLIPWNLNSNLADYGKVYNELTKIGPKFAKVGELLINELRLSYDKSVILLFEKNYSSVFGSKYQFGRKKTKEDYRWMNLLNLADMHVRQWRRYQMLQDLEGISSDFRVVIIADEQHMTGAPNLSSKTNIEWIGRVTADRLDQLQANSKMVLNCNPTYPNSIHARILNAMRWGCCVISDWVPGLNNFKDKEHLLYVDQKANLAEILHSQKINYQNIADNGRSFVNKNYTREKYSRTIFKNMDSIVGKKLKKGNKN